VFVYLAGEQRDGEKDRLGMISRERSNILIVTAAKLGYNATQCADPVANYATVFMSLLDFI